MTGQRHIENLALIGFMGTGKTAVGRQVASLLHFQFLDTDDLIEKRAGCSVAEIFSRQGEPAFREIERQVVADLAQCRKTVIATGGGLGANEENLASLKQHALVVCLWASPQIVWARVRSQSHRPLLQGPDPQQKIASLLAQREPIYRKADVLIGGELRSVRDVAQHVLHQFHLAVSKTPRH